VGKAIRCSKIEMRRRRKVVVSAIALAVLLLIGWLVIPNKAPGSGLNLTISTNAPKAYHSFFTAYLANDTGRSVVLYH
jgi:hypothetical protein